MKTFANFSLIGLLVIAILLLNSVLPGYHATPPANPPTPAFGRLPASFVPNRGQIPDREVKFQMSHGNSAAFFMEGEYTLLMQDRLESSEKDGKENKARKSPFNLRVRYLGANKKAEVRGVSRLSGVANFLYGKDPSLWMTGVETYQGMQYEDFYPGIHLIIDGSDGFLKSSFIVQPGADPAQIVWAFTGNRSVTIDDKGNLQIDAKRGNDTMTLSESAPVAWQEYDGEKKEVAVQFAINAAGEVSFVFPSGYDPKEELVIDPTIEWANYLGGQYLDAGLSVTRDSDNNILVAGYSSCIDYPQVNPLPGSGPSTGGQAIISKLDPTGTTLLYSTCLGGTNGFTGGFDIELDSANNIFVSGQTNASDFPIVSGIDTFSKTNCAESSCDSMFVAKLNPAGSAILFSSYLGGTNDEDGGRIALDADGMIYVVGTTNSNDFPVTANAYDTTFGGGMHGGVPKDDIVVAKFNPNLSGPASLVYSTYLGGDHNDIGNDIAVDNVGMVNISGQSYSSTGYPILNAVQSNMGGSSDGVLSKLDTTQSGANSLLFSTYFGGSLYDQASGIAVDNTGNAYITGHTLSTNFPQVNAYQPVQGGGCTTSCQDAFIAKIDTSNAQVVYSTYLGGSGPEAGYSITVDAAGRAYIVGDTRSIDFPTLNPVMGRSPDQCGSSACQDAFISVLSAAGSALEFSTYLGGPKNDIGYGIALDPNQNIFITGLSYSVSGNGGDLFVAKIVGLETGSGTPATYWSAAGDQAFAYFGWSVSGAGDINGDNLSDVIIGAPYYGANGAVFVYYGASTGMRNAPDLILHGQLPGERFGWSVSFAGDVNGDGFDDVVVGAVGCSNPQPQEGCAYLFSGSVSGLTTTPVWIVEGNQANAAFGYVVGAAGDVNGDGMVDLFVGAPNYTNSQLNDGKVFVYYGAQGSGPSTVASWERAGNQANAHLGLSAQTAGDVNGDLIDDFIVGTPNATNTQPNEGQADVFFGSVAGLAATASWTVAGGQAAGHFGEAVGSAGDVNGDGFSDVMVGAPDYDHEETDEGAVFIYLGSENGINTQPAWMGESNQTSAHFGVALMSLGHADQDQYADVLIGANRFSNGGENEGRVSIWYGDANGINGMRSWHVEGDQLYGNFGYALGLAGDINGDGRADFLIGAPQMDQDQLDEGYIYLFITQ